MSATGDATRRTLLANERTQLAWWRTGMASLAVGIGIGRVVPELSDKPHLPYSVLGVGFVLYGIAFILAGTWRERAVQVAVMEGRWQAQDQRMVLGLTVVGVLLSAATGILIVFDA